MPKVHHFFGGVHPKGNKNTEDFASSRLDDFSEVEIYLQQHIGPPCVCSVKKCDKVCVGTLIGRAEHPMSVPIHASVSGEVIDVRYVVSISGDPVEAVRIKSDGQYSLDPSCQPPIINSREDFIGMVRNAGIVGLGGAAFPTHVKLNPPPGKEPDILLINAAECEPYITSDYRQMYEHPDDILDGILAVLKWISIPKAVIGVEANKKLGAETLRREISKRTKKTGEILPIDIVTLQTIYPQGAEKMMIYSLTGRKIPVGKLPHDEHVLVMNITTLRVIGKYMKNGIPLVRRLLTLDGSALNTPGNINVPIGAMIPDVIEAAGGLHEEPLKIIMGGAMMGFSIDRTDVGIIKQNNAILFFGSKEAIVPPETVCIHCGRCLRVCPMRLVPTGIDRAARAQDIPELERYHVMDCIECGCCTYTCPAKRFLTQSIRTGKKILRSEAARVALEKKLMETASEAKKDKEVCVPSSGQK